MLQEIEARVSVRKFEERPVANALVLQLLESARLAPSGDNTQPWHFIVVQNQTMRDKIATANNNQKWMATAPVQIVCVADIYSRLERGGTELYLDENTPCQELKQIIRDTAIAAEHIVLQANALGLSSCWTADFVQEDIRPLLAIPASKYVVGVLAIGYAAVRAKNPKKRPLAEMVHNEVWQGGA